MKGQMIRLLAWATLCLALGTAVHHKPRDEMIPSALLSNNEFTVETVVNDCVRKVQVWKASAVAQPSCMHSRRCLRRTRRTALEYIAKCTRHVCELFTKASKSHLAACKTPACKSKIAKEQQRACSGHALKLVVQLRDPQQMGTRRIRRCVHMAIRFGTRTSMNCASKGSKRHACEVQTARKLTTAIANCYPPHYVACSKAKALARPVLKRCPKGRAGAQCRKKAVGPVRKACLFPNYYQWPPKRKKRASKGKKKTSKKAQTKTTKKQAKNQKKKSKAKKKKKHAKKKKKSKSKKQKKKNHKKKAKKKKKSKKKSKKKKKTKTKKKSKKKSKKKKKKTKTKKKSKKKSKKKKKKKKKKSKKKKKKKKSKNHRALLKKLRAAKKKAAIALRKAIHHKKAMQAALKKERNPAKRKALRKRLHKAKKLVKTAKTIAKSNAHTYKKAKRNVRKARRKAKRRAKKKKKAAKKKKKAAAKKKKAAKKKLRKLKKQKAKAAKKANAAKKKAARAKAKKALHIAKPLRNNVRAAEAEKRVHQKNIEIAKLRHQLAQAKQRERQLAGQRSASQLKVVNWGNGAYSTSTKQAATVGGTLIVHVHGETRIPFPGHA